MPAGAEIRGENMARYGEEELSILQQALVAFPNGIDSPADPESADYAAFVRLYQAGLINSTAKPSQFRGTPPRYRTCTITEAGRDVLDEYKERMGEVAPGDELLLLGLKEGREIIIGHVRNVHRASNGLGIQITIAEVEKATAQVDRSGPKAVKRLLTEWVPSSLTSATMKMLFDILKTALG